MSFSRYFPVDFADSQERRPPSYPSLQSPSPAAELLFPCGQSPSPSPQEVPLSYPNLIPFVRSVFRGFAAPGVSPWSPSRIRLSLDRICPSLGGGPPFSKFRLSFRLLQPAAGPPPLRRRSVLQKTSSLRGI